MIAIIGTILLIGYTTLSVSHGVDSIHSIVKHKPMVMEEDPSIAYEENPALLSIVEYYNTESEWAGLFAIDYITKFRAEFRRDNHVDVHVRYRHKAVAGSLKGRKDSFEQRVFLLEPKSDGFKVIGVGEYNSAQF